MDMLGRLTWLSLICRVVQIGLLADPKFVRQPNKHDIVYPQANRVVLKAVASAGSLMATNHVYTDRTLKLLFGTASSCAHPTCTQPVIHIDRGLLTPVAEIAHIRSRSPLGPRYDASYEPEKIDSFENLLLMCPAHHHVVDYHHSAYPTAELLEWKAAQVGDYLPGLSEPVDMAQLMSHMQDLFAGTSASKA